MASKRGLSTEEKKKRMLDWFHESQDFFQLKEIEKLCSTEKGITINTIKDTLISLCDDGSVETEKIGTSSYYWSLPSKALKIREQNLKQQEQDLKAEKERNEILKQNYESFNSMEDDSEKRGELVDRLEQLKMFKKKIQNDLDAYKENDPATVTKWKSEIVMSKKAYNRWVDNIYALRDFLKKKFNIDEKMLNKQFEIPDDLDYIS